MVVRSEGVTLPQLDRLSWFAGGTGTSTGATGTCTSGTGTSTVATSTSDTGGTGGTGTVVVVVRSEGDTMPQFDRLSWSAHNNLRTAQSPL